jgi:hypothetical protein
MPLASGTDMPASKMKNSRYAGELLVAAELARLGLVVSLHNSFGVNTPSFDLMASTNEGDRNVPIQVKALKSPNAFLIDPEQIKAQAAYVFVLVGEAGTLPSFHVAKGAQILDREDELFGKWGSKYEKKHGRGINWKKLPIEWENNWNNLGLGKLD